MDFDSQVREIQQKYHIVGRSEEIKKILIHKMVNGESKKKIIDFVIGKVKFEIVNFKSNFTF